MSQTRFTLDPRLLIYTRLIEGERVFVAETNCAEPPTILRQSNVVLALLSLPGTFSREEAESLWEGIDFAGVPVSALWQALVELRIVISVHDLAISQPTAAEWNRYGWGEAYSYHFATRDYPFVRMDGPQGFSEDSARMLRYVAESPPPPIYQSFPRLASVHLERFFAEGDPSSVLAQFTSTDRRGVPGLGFLFDICFGERSTEPFGVQGEFLRKSIPSGGARHPTEIFFVSFDGSPVPAGVYHYNVQGHCLDQVKDGDFYEECSAATFDLFKKYEKGPVALTVFTTLYERAMWRYRDSRSWRAILIDIGHALMAFRVVSGELGFKHYTYQKFDDQKLHELLGIDPFKQTALFVGSLV